MKLVDSTGTETAVERAHQQWKGIFAHTPAAATLILITAHQSIIAASSFFLTRLVGEFQEQRPFQGYLILYLAAMLIPYFPGCASFVALQSWINRAHREFVTRFARTAYGFTDAHCDSGLRSVSESMIARNSFLAIRDYLTFIHGLVGFLLNSTLSIVVLGIMLPGNLLTGYFFTLSLCALLIVVMRTSVARKSSEMEKQFAYYGQILARVWANTTLGNRYHYENWSRATDTHATAYYGASTRLQWLKQAGNLSLALTALGPTIFLVWNVVKNGHADAVLIAAVIVNLTRIFHILNSLSALVYQVLDLSSMNARIKMLFAAEQDLLAPRDSPKSPAGVMSMNGEPVRCFAEATRALIVAGTGRFTIRGENGAGKSTLLRFVKKSLGDRSLLLPAQQSDLVWRNAGDKVSTGQSMLMQLEEAVNIPDIDALLLDEWDANLDQSNRIAVDQMLSLLSETKLILEIRH
ncbi:ABC transporter ATP-binding protein [Pandoraea sputorum]|uniref:ATP-binding cassette domain-containing protein n=1 Tax=Pandoraea sputorum TaxID=93222 RepID=UPI0030C6960C